MIITDIASALEFLHSKGVVHGDLKLEDVLCVYNDCQASFLCSNASSLLQVIDCT